MTYSPRVLDLFCGAGGLSLGFRNAGCTILGGIDHEHWPVETHHENFPDCIVKRPPSDLTKLKPEDLKLPPGSVDILIGGPPCQGFSQVGRAKIRSLGKEKDRDLKNILYRQFIAFVDFFRPPYFVIENVQGMKTFKGSAFLEDILHELEFGPIKKGYSFDGGYEVRWKILHAEDFGVPQMRHRLFIIGRRKDCPELAINFPEPLKSKRITLKDAIGDLPRITAPVLKGLVNGGIHQDPDRKMKYRFAAKNAYQKMMREGCKDLVSNHICRGHNPKDLKIFKILKQGQKYIDLPPKYRRYRDDIFDDKYRKLKEGQPCWTLTAHMQRDCLAFIHPRQNRSLSAREAARVQSFPDSFVFVGPLTKLFRMIGNAVPPQLAQQVAAPIVAEIRKHELRIRTMEFESSPQDLTRSAK